MQGLPMLNVHHKILHIHHFKTVQFEITLETSKQFAKNISQNCKDDVTAVFVSVLIDQVWPLIILDKTENVREGKSLNSLSLFYLLLAK